MKHIMKSVLALLLLVVMLTSCNSGGNTPQSTTDPNAEIKQPSEEDLYPAPIKQLLANNQPYSLEFTSNGDGTCYVSRLYLNNRYETAFDLIIPEKSPAGDVVTGIDFGDSFDSLYDVIPKFLTWERVLEIKSQVDADYPGEMGGMIGTWWINAYMQYDLSQASPEKQQEMLEKYPILEYNMNFGIWLDKMSNTVDACRRMLYADITPSLTKQYYEEFIQEAREAGTPEELLTPYKELLEALPTYVNYSEQIRYLHIPSSVTDINVKPLIYLMIELPQGERMPIRGVVFPELDAETTLEIYTTFIESTSRASHKYAEYKFFIFSQSTSSNGYEGISGLAVYSEEEPQTNILAWHYVDGVPTLWK